MADAIRIEGLNEFVGALKRINSDLPKVLRVAFNAAGQEITDEARSKVPSRSGRAKGSVKMKSTQKLARIVGGSNRVPYYPWLDFGGTTPRGGKRPWIKDGRYIYASYFKHREQLGPKLEAALIDAARSAGVEVD